MFSIAILIQAGWVQHPVVSPDESWVLIIVEMITAAFPEEALFS